MNIAGSLGWFNLSLRRLTSTVHTFHIAVYSHTSAAVLLCKLIGVADKNEGQILAVRLIFSAIKTSAVRIQLKSPDYFSAAL